MVTKQEALAIVNADGLQLHILSLEHRNDRDIVLAAVSQDGNSLQYATDELKKDRDIVLAAASQNGKSLQYASSELKNDRDFVLAAASQSVYALAYALAYAPAELKNDRDIVLAAVSKHGNLLQLASAELKNDREIVLAAVSKHGKALQYASSELKNDRDIVLAAASQNGKSLQYASSELKNDRDFVLAAASQSVYALAYALAYAPAELKNDRDIVLAAVSKHGNLLQLASAELKNDRDIVLAAVSQGGYALKFAPTEFQNDRDIVLAAVSNDEEGETLEFASAELKNDRDIVLAAVLQNGWALEHASAELQNDNEIVLAAVSQNGDALQYASAELQNDRDFVLAAVLQNGDALAYASAELQNDREIVLAAVSQNGYALYYASAELQNNRDIVLAAVSQDGHSLEFASAEFKNDRNIVLAAVSSEHYLQSPYSPRIKILNHISEQLKESYFYNYLKLIAVKFDIDEFNTYILSRRPIQAEPIAPFIDIIKSCIEECDIERLLWLLQHYAQNITYSESNEKFIYQEPSDISSAWNGYHLAILTAIELNQPEIIQHLLEHTQWQTCRAYDDPFLIKLFSALQNSEISNTNPLIYTKIFKKIEQSILSPKFVISEIPTNLVTLITTGITILEHNQDTCVEQNSLSMLHDIHTDIIFIKNQLLIIKEPEKDNFKISQWQYKPLIPLLEKFSVHIIDFIDKHSSIHHQNSQPIQHIPEKIAAVKQHLKSYSVQISRIHSPSTLVGKHLVQKSILAFARPTAPAKRKNQDNDTDGCKRPKLSI